MRKKKTQNKSTVNKQNKLINAKTFTINKTHASEYDQKPKSDYQTSYS